MSEKINYGYLIGMAFVGAVGFLQLGYWFVYFNVFMLVTHKQYVHAGKYVIASEGMFNSINGGIIPFGGECLHPQLGRRIQLQNLVAGSIPRNSKFCVYIPKVSVVDIRRTSSLNLQKGVSTVGSPEEPVHRTPTYDPIYRGGNGLWTEGIHKRQVISEEEKIGVSL